MSSLTTAATPSAICGAGAVTVAGATGVTAAAVSAAWSAADLPVMPAGSSTLGAVMREGGPDVRDCADAPADASRGSARAAATIKASRRSVLDIEKVDPVFTTFYLKSGRWYPVLPNVTSRRRTMMVSLGRRVRL